MRACQGDLRRQISLRCADIDERAGGSASKEATAAPMLCNEIWTTRPRTALDGHDFEKADPDLPGSAAIGCNSLQLRGAGGSNTVKVRVLSSAPTIDGDLERS